MRIVIAMIVLLLCMAMPVQALSPVNIDMIKTAQRYGQMNYQQNTDLFLLQWTAYDEQAPRINAYTERAYIYSPFLLIALHAKDAMLAGHTPRLADSEKVLTDYNGFLTFELVLYGTSSGFADQISAALLQEKRLIINPHVSAPAGPQAMKNENSDMMYRYHCYLYFADKAIHPSKPIRLSVIAADKRERVFYFNLEKIR